MVKTEYPGVAKLVSRAVWECGSAYPRQKQAKPGKPWDTGVCGISSERKTGQKPALTTWMTTDGKISKINIRV